MSPGSNYGWGAHAVSDWMSEGFRGSMNHASQVLWRYSSSVGCGMAFGPGNCQVVCCHYDPPGNMLGVDGSPFF